MNSSTLVPCAVLLTSLLAGAGDWPQWRGPGRDGMVIGARLPETWPPQLPMARWRSEVGHGYSSPVVVDGRVFIMGMPKPGEESCLCFDAETGDPLWAVTYANAYRPPPGCTADRGPNSTPAVDGDRVYMLGLGGMFHCLDVKTGKVLWKHDFAAEYWGVERFETGEDAWSPTCGAAASPLVLDRTVVIPVGGKKAGTMVAFDRETGEVVWSALTDRSSYASPLVAHLAGARQLIGFTGTRMVGLDLADRKLLWEYPFPAGFDQTILTPVIWKDFVLIGGEGRPTTAVQLAREGDAVTATPKWRTANLCAYTTTPVVMKDHMVGLDLRTRALACVDLETGEAKWFSPRIGAYASVVLAGEQLLTLANTGELIVARANPAAYEEIGRFRVSDAGNTWAHPAIVGSRLYIKDRQHLLCFDMAAPPAAP